ncbi:ATP-dependent DNA ligase [Piscinibacter sakaiensis]|uniref:ATP-dependent DNA ligase n=1 Tax=Piscinibacter sakaiensis TaxID=1547922 RepID=A0A0K8NWV6_PISS1|nr:ATP-dependent DNA ligase [Piscinibacter sakaiensis]GAP34764.1 ATP-dependent DNA ligase [Piscinibacter sakaiensis]
MRRFAALFQALDASTATSDKLAALRHYLAEAPPADAAWALYFLAGGKPRQTVPTALLRTLACREAGIADWLFEACYQAVGDLAETIALVLPPPRRRHERGLAEWIEQGLLPLREATPERQAEAIADHWDGLDTAGRFLLTKLIGGGFRVGVSKLLVQRALAEHAGLDPKWVAQRMMGWTDKSARPDAAAYARLVAPVPVAPPPGGGDTGPAAGAAVAAEALPPTGQPFPFFLAHPLEAPLDELPARLGPPSDWLVEWKYDGIRAQVVRAGGRTWVWTRGEELVSDRFPEVCAQAERWPDGSVVDGEILVWKDGRPAPFALLQQRIGRKTLTRRVLAEAPVRFIAYDLLAEAGQDLREQPQQRRRAALEAFAARQAPPPDLLGAPLDAALPEGLPVSPEVHGSDWDALAARRAEARERGVEGLMLKHRAARYGQGRRKQEGLAAGTWWKWKIEPLSVDAVLVYAQAGHGRRASVYTDYTFAVWNRPPADAAEAAAVVEAIAARRPPQPGALQLVPFAKAYSGLTDAEFAAIDREVRAHTLEKFGPVRSLRPTRVFELGFEGIARSPRHRSGIAVRFPRMLRIRDDKPLHEADSLLQLEALLRATGADGAPREAEDTGRRGLARTAIAAVPPADGEGA